MCAWSELHTQFFFKDKLKELYIRVKVFALDVIDLDTLIAFTKDFESGKCKDRNIIDKYILFQNPQPISCERKIESSKIMMVVFQKYFSFYYFYRSNSSRNL